MRDPAEIRSRRSDGPGWSLAAAAGLVAVAFLWDRIAPPDRAAQKQKDKAFPENRDTLRHDAAPEMATEAEDRGRQASSPAEIPSRGWKDILWRVYGNIGDHRILALAAGMTYYSLLANSWGGNGGPVLQGNASRIAELVKQHVRRAPDASDHGREATAAPLGARRAIQRRSMIRMISGIGIPTSQSRMGMVLSPQFLASDD